MSEEYLPLHKEFGIFLVGWTGAVTITVLAYYIIGSPVWNPEPTLINIARDWISFMLMGIVSVFGAGCVVYMALVALNPVVDDIRKLFRNGR